jgi:hypothetical protein
MEKIKMKKKKCKKHKIRYDQKTGCPKCNLEAEAYIKKLEYEKNEIIRKRGW